MNLFFMSLIYPNEEFNNMAENCKTGMQLQLDNFQKLLINGMKQNPLLTRLRLCNAVPVGVFPKHYKKIILPKFKIQDGISLSSINLPIIKQKMREDQAKNELLQWLEHKDNRCVLLYSLYLPFMRAIAAAKAIHPDLKACLIVPDIPNEFGLRSGHKGIFAQAEKSMCDESLSLCKVFDKFVFLTEHMRELIPCNIGDYSVVEAIAPNSYELPKPPQVKDCYDKYGIPDSRPVVLYTGTVQEELGIGDMVKAFMQDSLSDVSLVICGSGAMESELVQISSQNNNIYYLGFIPRDDALLLQAGANMLINPRKPEGKYTRYSFPSKSMEYLLSGKPVLCYKLEGIPADYDQYFNYISNGNNGIANAINEVLSTDPAELSEKGIKARWFVMGEKNARAQGKKVLELLV